MCSFPCLMFWIFSSRFWRQAGASSRGTSKPGGSSAKNPIDRASNDDLEVIKQWKEAFPQEMKLQPNDNTTTPIITTVTSTSTHGTVALVDRLENVSLSWFSWSRLNTDCIFQKTWYETQTSNPNCFNPDSGLNLDFLVPRVTLGRWHDSGRGSTGAPQ